MEQSQQNPELKMEKKPDIIRAIEKHLDQSHTPFADWPSFLQSGTRNAFLSDASGAVLALDLHLENATALDLSSFAMPMLRWLNVSENKNLQTFVLPASLPELVHLDASQCALTEIEIPADAFGRQFLGESPRMVPSLYLQKNQLRDARFGGGCFGLELLDLSGNKLTNLRIPTGFAHLKYLYLNDNQIEDLHFSEAPAALNIIQLDNNRLRYLPDNLKDRIVAPDAVLEALYLGGNAPKDIPKIFLGDGGRYSKKSCLEDARIWFRELKDFPSEQNKVVKLMLTGNGNSGKSTLLCALRQGACTHDHQTTHGIQIETVEKPGIDYNVWDFGGQEVYHGTHRLFMESEALQVIVFDPETEAFARDGKRVRDRANEEQVMHHQIAYWCTTTKELSPKSCFFIVQNKKDLFPAEDGDVHRYADQMGAKFLHLGAKTGENLDELEFYLKKAAPTLPEFEMWMPMSWLKVRQFFIDNAQNEETSIKLISEDQFFQRCSESKVSEKSAPLLLEYLHHNGFLYRHPNLKGQIIADQRWALRAIYKPLDREAEHYQEFRNYNGKIRVERLFQIFGNMYSEDQKWLFLYFMESCGLCFLLNNKPWQEKRDVSDVYVFPEFLAPDKPRIVADLWKRAVDVHVLRYQLPWINYSVIQSFIATLGRKTDAENIWRYGIHIQTDEGWFKVELDYDQKALILSIEKSAMNQWLKPILEALPTNRDSGKWEIAGQNGYFEVFDLDHWEQQLKEKVHEKPTERDLGGENKTIEKRLEDKFQQLDRQVVLFLSASPAAAKVNCGSELAHILEKVCYQDNLKGKVDIIPQLNITSDQMSDVIKKYMPNIVHFCGHGGEVNPDNPRESGLLFISDDHVGTKFMDAAMLDKIFASIKTWNPGLEVVLLNACFSEPQAAAISKHNIYAIGSSEQIKSMAARKFAVGFYSEFLIQKDIVAGIRFGLEKGTTEEIDIDRQIHLFYQGNKKTI